MIANAISRRIGNTAVAAAAAGLFVLAIAFARSNALHLTAPDATFPTGAWLTDLVVRFFTTIPLPFPQSVVLSVFSAIVIGALLAWLYRRLIYNDWYPGLAMAFVAACATNALVVIAVAGDHQAIPLMIAAGALVPAIRRLESVGDVQAEMSFGMVLPLFFLASPATTLLIPVLALVGARSDLEARHDFRAYLAMLLVALLPTMIVLAGLFGLMGPAGIAEVFRSVYVEAFTPRPMPSEDLGRLLSVVGYGVMPYLVIIAAYIVIPDRRRQPLSAATVIALPAYLTVGIVAFSWDIAITVPAAVLLAAYASWLSVARVRPSFQVASLALIVVGTGLSWTVPVLTGEASWIMNRPELRGTLAPNSG